MLIELWHVKDSWANEGCFYFILLNFKKRKDRNMKHNLKSLLSLTLAAVLALSLTACNQKAATSEQPQTQSQTVEATGLWANATYLEDTELGQGAKDVVVEVQVEDQTVTFTIHTDETTVGAALLANELIAGDTGEYGLYVKEVNGITADYDVDQSYWAFYIDGEYAMSGVDTTEIVDGAVYRLAYTK